MKQQLSSLSADSYARRVIRNDIGDSYRINGASFPFPPSKNGYWRTFRNRQILSKKAREYRNLAASVGWLDDLDALRSEADRFFVVLEYTMPDKRRRDVSNYVDSLFDAITKTKAIWFDDSQIAGFMALRFGVDESGLRAGSVFVTVFKLTQS